MNINPKLTAIALSALAMASFSALTLLPSVAQAQATPPIIVSGKVVNVGHEKVSVNNVWLDKVTVTVESCEARGALKTVHYSPASISDRTVLGHLFSENIHSADSMSMEAQQQTSGYGIFWVDQNQRVLRTGILGHNVDCKNVQGLVSQFP
jgi:hypothetical protein